MSEGTKTPWKYCCDKCLTISAPDHPIAKVTSGDWGDDYPSLRISEPGILAVAEPYMAQVTYGHIPKDEAIANAALIVSAVNSHKQLVEALRVAKRMCDNINEFGHVTDQEFHDAAEAKIDAALKALEESGHG
jgi:hypothetical protein